MALLTDSVNAGYDIDTVYLDGVLVMAEWDIGNTVSDYISGLMKRLYIELGDPGMSWTWAIDSREKVAPQHVRYTVGNTRVDYVWVKTPKVL